MRYYYDTEFNENGSTIDFISIGVVAEDGREYYAVSNELDTRRVAQNKWLMENVMPSIEHEKFEIYLDHMASPLLRDIFVTDKAAKSRHKIAFDIASFIGADRNAELWAWYGAYDHVCLAQLFGRMIDLPNMIPMYTNDLKTMVQLAGNPRLPAQPAGLHNALEDARWNKVRYDYLVEKLNGRNSA